MCHHLVVVRTHDFEVHWVNFSNQARCFNPLPACTLLCQTSLHILEMTSLYTLPLNLHWGRHFWHLIVLGTSQKWLQEIKELNLMEFGLASGLRVINAICECLNPSATRWVLYRSREQSQLYLIVNTYLQSIVGFPPGCWTRTKQ